jgi:hypothetical protein
VSLRAPTLDDVPGITRLFNRGSEELFGEADEGEDDVRRFLTSEELDPAEDIRLAEADGELVGCADIYPHTPDLLGRRAITERREPASRSAPRLEPRTSQQKGGDRVMAFAWVQDERRAGVRRRRLRADARDYRMGIEFDGELEEPRAGRCEFGR